MFKGMRSSWGISAETCPVLHFRVVSEWRFQKDGVDFSMKDLANETRSSQLQDSNILFGIGEKT